VTARRAGRRPGDPEVTRRTIITAARTRFGEAGFERATIRSIAAEARVDPALIHHHFGNKQDLFAAAHEIPVSPAQLVAAIKSGPRAQMGHRIARFYLSIIGGPKAAPLSLLRAAATNESAARMMREFIESIMLRHAHDLVDLPRPRVRLALVGSHMIGVVFARSLVGLSDLANCDAEDIVTAVAPTLQRYLTDPDLFTKSAS